MEELEVGYQILEGGQALLTLRREHARNALSAKAVAELTLALERAEADQAARVIVLTGAGRRAFCAGGDLSFASDEGFLGQHDGRRAYAALLRRLSEVRKPTLAKVNGHALAGGLGLVLACDLAVAAEHAELGTPEIDVGLFPMMVMALLQRHVGRKRALELCTLGERISAVTAREWGLLNKVVPEAELDAATAALAGKLAGKSQAILALGRRAFFTAEDLPVSQALEHLASQLSLNLMTEDAAEGVGAFLEKRKPSWRDR